MEPCDPATGFLYKSVWHFLVPPFDRSVVVSSGMISQAFLALFAVLFLSCEAWTAAYPGLAPIMGQVVGVSKFSGLNLEISVKATLLQLDGQRGTKSTCTVRCCADGGVVMLDWID